MNAEGGLLDVLLSEAESDLAFENVGNEDVGTQSK